MTELERRLQELMAANREAMNLRLMYQQLKRKAQQPR
jgi:hypothetical protein